MPAFGLSLLSLRERLSQLLGNQTVMIHDLQKEQYDFKDHWTFRESRARSYFLIKKGAKQIIQKGPPVAREKHAREFKKRWKKTFVKAGNLYTKREPKKVEKILNPDSKILKEMSIDSFNFKKIA